MNNFTDAQIPSKKFEKMVYNYLNTHYSRDEPIIKIANELFYKFEMPRQRVKYPTLIYVIMVDEWRSGYYDKLYDKDKHGDKGKFSWQQIIKDIQIEVRRKYEKDKE